VFSSVICEYFPSLRLGGLYGQYKTQEPSIWFNDDMGGYVGLTSNLKNPSIGFTGSYAVYVTDTLELRSGDSPTYYEGYNNVTLLKAFAGFRFSSITVGGGWISLKHTVRYSEYSGKYDSLYGPTLAILTSSAITPRVEVDAEVFYSPRLGYLNEYAPEGYGSGGGLELRGSYSILAPLSVEMGANLLTFRVVEYKAMRVNYFNMFTGVRLSF
jgi:hypothetical protein